MKFILALFALVSGLTAQTFPIDSTWSAYSFNWSNGRFELYPTSGGSFVFSAPPKTINAIDRRFSRATSLQGTSMFSSFSISSSGTPSFAAPDDLAQGCPPVTNLRFFITSNDMGAKKVKLTETGRWWSPYVSFPLAVTSGASIAVAIDPSQWSDASGHLGTFNAAHTSAFWAVVHGVREIGLTFGGGCFFNHGVSNAGAPATFTLFNFGVQ